MDFLFLFSKAIRIPPAGSLPFSVGKKKKKKTQILGQLNQNASYLSNHSIDCAVVKKVVKKKNVCISALHMTSSTSVQRRCNCSCGHKYQQARGGQPEPSPPARSARGRVQ